MAWTIDYSTTAKEQLKKLDKQIARRIFEYMQGRVAVSDNPRNLGKALTGELAGLWRYRVGDYRVICKFRGDTLCIAVLQVGNRREIYR